MPNQASNDITEKITSYFYTIKHTVFEKTLCEMEMRHIFAHTPDNKYFFSDRHIYPSRSPYIKLCISVIYTGDTLEDIVQQILQNNLSYNKFKVRYVNLDDFSIPYDERRRIESIVGFNVNGEADVRNPEVLLGVTQLGDRWLFGKYEENTSVWAKHDLKPYYYSNALSTRMARALVNIAIHNHLDYKLIDPCCGIGTVVMEALSMSISIRGCEINPLIAENARKNLEFFDYPDVIANEDMHNIKDNFDAAILDLPYGLFNPTTLEEQLGLIRTTRRIAKRTVFVSFEDMKEHFVSCGFKVLDNCQVAKGQFVRHITLCE